MICAQGMCEKAIFLNLTLCQRTSRMKFPAESSFPIRRSSPLCIATNVLVSSTKSYSVLSANPNTDQRSGMAAHALIHMKDPPSPTERAKLLPTQTTYSQRFRHCTRDGITWCISTGGYANRFNDVGYA